MHYNADAMSNFNNDMNWTSGLFEQHVWPSISELCGGGEIITMEISVDQLADAFDKHSGIDAWQVTPDSGMRGIGSRIQRIKDDVRPYDSFTVRAKRFNGVKTEFAKRKEAVESNRGFVYPYLTVQAYVREQDNQLLSAAVCKTADLIWFIENGYSQENQTTNAAFYVCFWRDMVKAGVKIKTYQNHELQLTLHGKNYSMT